MGILDDAIREHLELKRKHGVPDEEVERQEEEALGPARREVAQQPEDAEIAADAGDDSTLFDGEPGDAPVAEEPASGDDETAIAEPPARSTHPLGRSRRRPPANRLPPPSSRVSEKRRGRSLPRPCRQEVPRGRAEPLADPRAACGAAA